MQDNRDDLYLNLRDAGVGEDVIGTQQDFKNFVTNEKNTRDLYKNLRDAGVGEDVIGTEDDFYNFVAPDFSGNKSSGTTKVGSAAQQVVNEYDQSAKDNAKAPEDLSAATAGAKIGGNISLTPAKPNNQQTAQPAVDNTAKSVMDANGTPVEQPKATGPKTQFVSEDPNYVSGTPKEEALKKYPWMQPNQVYLWNKTTKEPVVSYFDENGQAVTDEDLQIKKAKSEITGQEDTEYMHPEAAALQLPNGNTRGVRLKKGALTQMADEIMRKEYGDNYLNTQFGRDGNVYTGAERRDLGAQQLYDGLNSDVRKARISFAVADDKGRSEILSRIKAKWGKVADETSLVNAVSDENAAKEDIDIVAQQNINDLNAEIQNISQQMDQRGAEIDNASSPFVDQTFNARDVDPKYRLLQSKLNYAQNALKSWENVKNSGSLDALAGFKDAVMDISAWDFGFSDLKNAVSLLTAKGKDKQELVNLYGRSAEAAKFEDKYNPDSYRYGKIAGASIPFALQFVGTGGGFKSIGSAVSKKATSIAEKYALEGLKKQIVKGLGVAVGDIARAYTMSGTVQGLNTISDILNRSAGELTVDKQGNYQLKSDEPLLKSIYKGVTASAIENYTEMLGERLNIGGNLMRMLPKIGLGRVSNAITKIGTQDWYKVCNNWLSRAGVNDFGGEVLEEEIGIVLNAALVGDNPLLNGNGGLLDLRTQKDILGGMLLSISSMRAGALAMYGVKKGVGLAFVKTLDMYDKMQLNQSDKGGQSIFGEGWTEIKDEIDNTPNDKVNSVIEKLAKEHPSKDEQSAIIDYAVKLLKTRGHNLGIAMASDGENDEGAQEEIKDMPDLSQPNAKYINKDDGMIHKASLYPDASDPTGTAKDVFIIKGNLVTNEDGSINKDASDKTIIYIDGNDEVHIASPDKFAAAYPPISNNEVQQANEGVEDEEAQTTGNYNKGDEVNINVNGINYTAIIQGKDGFENYNVYYEDEDGMMHPAKFTADQLNEMNGKSTVSNGQQATSEQPAQQEQETQQEQTAQEEQKPAIPTDEKGNTLYHQVPVETTINDLYDGKLDDNEIKDFVDANINEADKQLEKINKKAPKIGTNKNEYLKKKQEWQKQIEDATRIRDYWNSVKDYIAKQTHTTPEEIQAAQDELSGEAAKREYQGMAENIQQDPISVASDFIRGAKITPESFKAETGYGAEEQRKFVGMIAKAENGGKSIDRLAEELVSYDNAEMNGSLFGGDTSSAKDAILSALQGAGTRGELKQTNEAEEQAYVDARNAARDAQYMEQYGMTYEEYLAYEEQIMPTIWREYNNYDETAFNNMYAEEIEQLLKSRENDTTGEKPTDDRGNQVLPEQQVNQQPGSEGGTEQGTKIQAGLQSDNENAVAPEEAQQEVGVTDRRIEEKPYATVESKGGYVNLHRERYFKDGITYTHAVAIRNGKVVNMPTALFPIPKYMEILDVPEGVSVLGINELREDSKGNSAATVVVRYEDGGTGKMDVRLQPVVAQKIANAEAETNTNPTEGQKEAGNYRKGHVRIDGYDITIEQPKGSVRRGTDANGKQWEQKMNNTYGYIRGTEGVDGDHIDIFLSDNPTEGNVYVVDQVNPDGSFDEHKVMYGFHSADEARAAYLSNYEEGWKGLGSITEVSKDEFKKWVNSSKRKTKPFSEYKSVNAIGAQNEERSDGIRFREDDKSLIAVHNLDESSLSKALDLGGFPMPSIAVTNKEIGHNEYGDISLLFDKSSIDPSDRRNKVYGGDAWTPVFPEINLKISESVADKIRNKIDDLLQGKEYVKELGLHIDNSNLTDKINRSKSFREAYKNNDAMKIAFLTDKGVSFKPGMQDATYSGMVDNSTLKKIVKEVNKGKASDLVNLGYDETMELEPIVRKIVSEYKRNKAMQSIPEERRKDSRIFNLLLKNADKPLSFADMNNLFYDAYKYEQQGDRKVVDTIKTRDKLSKKFTKKLQGEYENWLDEISEGIVEKQGIRNEKDLFTPSGNRRSWEQLYDEITLDNVVKAMKEQAEKGGGMFGGSIFGAAQKDITSIDELRKLAKKRLADIDSEEYEKEKDAITERLSNISIPGTNEGFGGRIDMFRNISDAVASSNTPSGIYKYLKKYYPKITKNAADEIADIVKDIQNMATRYFEAKPYRAVGFNEVKVAVVPRGMNKELVSRLESYGVEVRTYKKGDAESRKRAINLAAKKADILFRRQDTSDEYPINERNQIETEISSAVEELSSSLNTPIRVVRNLDDVKNSSARRAIEAGRNIKAWFDPNTKEVVVYMPNATDANDVKRSILHEVVGHKGLRELIGEERYDAEMQRLFNLLPDTEKEKVQEAADKKYQSSIAIAMDEYLAEQAELDKRPSWWGKIVSAVRDLLRRVGIGVKLTDADVNYLLWKSKKKLSGKDAASMLEDVVRDESNELLSSVSYREITDKEKIKELDEQPKIKVYRAMQLQDGKLLPPMSGKVKTTVKDKNGKERAKWVWREPTNIGKWEEAEERPDLANDDGTFTLNKGNNSLNAAYNPYIHTSRSPINDQFSSAWNRDELVTVEVEVPVSELTSGYRAEKAKDSVGEVEWKSGPVGRQLAKIGKPRLVILSRYDKPVRILSPNEVADEYAKRLEGTNIEVPFNTVSPSLRDALVAKGIKIGAPENNNAGKASLKEYEKWKRDNDIRYRFIGETGAKNLDAAEEATTRLDNLSVAREMENVYNEKKARIEKLKDSKPVDVKYNGEYDLNRKPAKDWLKENVRGEYTNNDTGEKIGISKVGINEVTSHGSKDKVHLKSLIAIPQMIEQSIFIDEIPNTKDHDKYDSYKYYVCGLKIDNVDYIVKLVVGVKGDNKYYDHRLTEIEKGTLIDNLNGLSNSVAENQNANISYGKDTKLQSILQTNDRENARKIKLATGWERGADGKWRYETTDFEYHPKGDARRNDKYKESEWYKELHVLEEKLFNGETLTDGETKRFDELSARVNAIRDNDRNTERIYLDDYVEDNELFKAYPELKQTKIDFVDLPNEGYSAKYNEKENRITVNQAKSIDDKSAIAHEVQHAIQHIEGFAKGGNGTEIQQAIDQIESKISDILKSDEYKKAINDFGKEYNQKIDKEVENTYPNLDPERKQAIRMAMRDDALIEYKKKSPILQRLSNLESELNVLRYDSSYKSSYVYNNLSGEVEARNVEARINMTPEQRRQSLASETEDVAREDQLFIYDNLGVSARQGTGALTDSELSNANDPTGKMLGEPSRTPAQQREFAERERQRMADRAREVADILHLDNVEIVTDASTLQGRRAKAKGFYSRDNGKIVIVVPNHVDMADIEQTVLHEAVAHYGLRKLFGKNFDTFLYNVYNNASQEVREKITQLAAKHNWDFATATEEYLASLAEKTNFEDLNASWWDKIKSLFLKLLHSIGLKGFTGVSLSDNELRYILWRSYENLKNPGRYRSIIDEARDMSMQNDMKVGNYSVQNSRNNVAEGSDNVLYREAKEVEEEINNDWRDEYDKKLSTFSFKLTEAAQDAMRSVKILQDIIAKETSAPISDDENVYWRENRLSSVNKYEQEYYAENYFKPIVTAIANLVKYGARYNDKGKDIINSDNDILKYLIAKHGIERNNYFREREAMNARKPYEDQIKELQKQVEKGEIKEEDANKKIVKLQEQADKAEMKKRVDVLHKDYSGLTELFQDKKDFDTLAASYVSDFEKKFDTEPLWNAINRATKGTLRKAFVDGLISRESYENTAKMYEYYIPLRGWANDVASEAYNYKGSGNSSRKILQTAKGRTSLADNPISEIGRMMQDAIFQGNRNRMKQAVYNLAMNHDTSLLNIKRQWYQNIGTKDDPIWERVFPDLSSDMTAEQVAEEVEDFESRMRELKKEGKATQSRKGLILRLHTTKREEAQHRISVAINGKEYNIFVNGNPRAAQAINGELNDVDRYGSAVAKVNRFLSQVYTSVNPEFVVTNYQRDAGFAASIVASTEPWSYQKEWAKNMTIYNPITTGVYLNSLIKKAKTGNINPNNKAERYMQEFLSNGGETGFTNMLSADDYKKQIKRDIKSINSVVSLPKAARAAVAFTERANTVFEDATRYATYVTSREQGRTIDRSIRDAKEISLNFNTRGADGLPGDSFIYRFFRGLRRWMIFVNPSIQGLNKAGMAFRNHPLRSSMMIAGLPTLLGYALPAIMQAVVGGGDGDDDDKNVVESYKDLPKWVRRTNIAIPIGGNNFVTIPLSYELRVSYGLGEMIWEYGEGMIDKDEIAVETLSQLSDLLPVSFSNGTVAQSISPSIARPLIDIIQNRNFYGKKIYNDSQFIEGYPEYMKAYAGTPKWLVKSTEVLNNVIPNLNAGVSDKYTPGAINVNPAIIDYLLSSYLGGLYNFPSKFGKTISMIWDEDMRDIQNVPILSRNWKNSQSGNPYNSGDRYKTYMKEYDLSKQRFNGYKKEAKNDVPEFLNSLKDLLNTPSGKRMLMIDAYKRGGLDKLNQRIRDIDAYDNERYEGEKDALTKKRDEVKEELINKLDSISDGTLDFVNGEWIRK